MAIYLVTARPRGKLAELENSIANGELLELEPFGKEITRALTGARLRDDGVATWEEVDYCVPPLAAERAAVLDRYFREIEVEPVKKGEGWSRIAKLPFLLPGLPERRT
jgi:hypothetical protein